MTFPMLSGLPPHGKVRRRVSLFGSRRRSLGSFGGCRVRWSRIERVGGALVRAGHLQQTLVSWGLESGGLGHTIACEANELARVRPA